MKIPLIAVIVSAAFAADAVPLKTVGNWKIDFDQGKSVLTAENAERKVSLSGPLSFESKGKAWTVVNSRDAARGRLSIVDPTGTALSYVSFRGEGGYFSLKVFNRAGANFFPGTLTWKAKASFRRDSFACRTIPQPGEQVLNFGDGAADTSLNDSIFAREEDFALRFFSFDTSVKTLGMGMYEVALAASVDDSAYSSIVVDADSCYYGSRWVPAYHPIDRRRCPKAPTGWMSWNIYFDKAGSAENLAEARIAAKYLKPFGLDIWSIESWQDNSLWLWVGENFHCHENKCYKPQFPEGMKWLADEIRKLGFKPGIWMTLYGSGDKEFHDKHPELYLHDKDGKPISNWAGTYMLDTTNPESLKLMTKLAREAREEWGYEFFKFDGMANTPRKFERPEIRARMKDPKNELWFENSVKAMRDGIGEDALFLACMGDFTGTEIQFADATRLGSDVVGCGASQFGENYHPLGSSPTYQWPVKWKNVLHQAQCTFTQIFINNIMAYTDPDTLMVGLALERHEAEVMATIVGLPGQLMFDGDKLACLPPDRMKMIQQVLPVADVTPRNLYPYAAAAMLPVWNLTVSRPWGDWHVVALFNWEDGPKSMEVSFEDLGLDADKKYSVYEFWSQEYAGEVFGSLGANLPMRSVKLFAVREATGRPQFVGDDRHITQGAVEIADERWDASKKELTLVVKAVGGFPFEYAVSVPDGFKFMTAASSGAKATARSGDGLVRVKVLAEKSADIPVTLTFE